MRPTGIDGDQSDNTLFLAGAVYVFTRAGSVWSQQAYVKASNTGAQDRFSKSLALSADGNTLAVGADGERSAATGIGGDETDNSATFAGAVFVFTRAGSVWSQQAYVKASNTNSNDRFGASLGLSADGDALAVAANQEGSAATDIDGDQTDNSAAVAGAVYMFTRTGGAWSQQVYVKASNTGANDQFGYSLAISADADTMAVGANVEDGGAPGVNGDQSNNAVPNAGSVYLY